MSRAVEAHIDLNALRHNLQVIKRFAPQSKVIAVIKANGYGHGMTEVAQALSNVDAYGVACLPEAQRLRSQGIELPILLLSGFFDHQELNECSELGLHVAIHQLAQVDQLEAAALTTPVDAWLKIDTGMHRLGITPDQFESVYQRLRACSSVNKLRFMTHFARADEVDRPETDQQIECFDQLVQGIEVEQSMSNSAAIIKYPQSHRDWVRPGIMLYGVAPFAQKVGLDYDLRPVMTFSSHIMAIRLCKKGDALGYGGTWVCPEDMPIGIVAVGYGDGYPRHASHGTPVLINGIQVPLVGRVSMDSIFVDLRTCPEAKLGDEAILWGKGLPVEEVAACAATIPYELLCKVTARTRYIYSNS